MKRLFIATVLALSLTSCAEITYGLRDISQGVFLQKRIGNISDTSSHSLYDNLINLSKGKVTNSVAKMKTSNLMIFKSLDNRTLIQANEVTYDYDQVELLTVELKRHNITVKESKAGKKCELPLSNKNYYDSRIYEFMFNNKKMYILTYGMICGSCLYNPVVITRNSPCKVLNSI